MVLTYPVVLRDGRLEWGDAGPPPIPEDGSVRVSVTVLDLLAPRQGDGAALLAALEKIAAVDGAAVFGDPLEWQCETRRDRPLPGREP